MRNASRLSSLLTIAAIAIILQACNKTPTSANLPLAVTDTPLPLLNTPDQADSYQLPQLSEGQINVREVNGFSDEYNTWYIYGLISNDSSDTVSDIEIEIQLLNTAGGVLYTDTTNPAIRALAPGEDAPFILYTYEALSGVHTIAATILSHQVGAVDRANLDFSGMTVWVDNTFHDVYLAGNVVNNTGRPVQISGLAATLLDESGALGSANAAFPFLNYLPPGISAPFRVLFDIPADDTATMTNYNLYLDARFTDEAKAWNLITSQGHNGYLDAYDKFHLVGTISNNSEAYLNVRLLAGIFNDAGDCIDVASLYLPVAVPPGESLPYDFDLWGALDSTPDAYRSATQYEIYIDWFATSEAYITPVQITTSADSNTFDGYSTTFSGNVDNNTGQALDSATVIVSLFDRTTGELIATDYTHVSGPIEAGGTMPYAIYVYPQADMDPTNLEFTITAFGQ
jgi:hypothetical protein